MAADDRAPPVFIGEHTEWYHGSPRRLQILQSGSTVTPVIAYARAMSHKPTELGIQIRENTDAGERRVTFKHNGARHGYLYRVLVDDPSRDVRQHPESSGAAGEEVLTTRDLQLEFLEELPVRSSYDFTQDGERSFTADRGIE